MRGSFTLRKHLSCTRKELLEGQQYPGRVELNKKMTVPGGLESGLYGYNHLMEKELCSNDSTGRLLLLYIFFISLTHTHTHIHTHTHTHTYTHTDTRTHTHTFTVCLCVSVSVCW